jgi:predicted dehydrogenase
MSPRSESRAIARPIRVALVGYGLGGQSFHAPLIAATSGLQLTAIVTANPARRAAASRDHPHAHLVESADHLWQDAKNYDLAVITSPNRFHVPLARAAIAAGIAVVVDKPMAATAHEARVLIDEAQRLKIPLTVYQNRRWDGDFLTVKRLLAEGALGEVLRFESRFDNWRPAPKDAWRESGDPQDAGGLLYDLGSHLIDQALHLFGPVTHVYAEIARRRPGVKVDDDFFVALHHAAGVRSHLWGSSVAAQEGMRMRVLGTRAAYTKSHRDVQEPWLRSGRGPTTPGYGDESAEQWGRLGVGDESRGIETERGNYARFYAQTEAWLCEGGPPPVNPEDSMRGLEIIEAAQRSAAEYQIVPLATG